MIRFDRLWKTMEKKNMTTYQLREKCGIDSLGVRWGHGSREELENSGFTYLADAPDDVADMLK